MIIAVDYDGTLFDEGRINRVLIAQLRQAQRHGDTVILCEADRLLLVDDYTEELNQYLGGASHG